MSQRFTEEQVRAIEQIALDIFLKALQNGIATLVEADRQMAQAQPKFQQAAEAKPASAQAMGNYPKGEAAASTAKWEQMPPTNKGPWERTYDIKLPETSVILQQTLDKDKPVFVDGALYWALRTDGVVVGLGRRRKAT